MKIHPSLPQRIRPPQTGNPDRSVHEGLRFGGLFEDLLAQKQQRIEALEAAERKKADAAQREKELAAMSEAQRMVERQRQETARLMTQEVFSHDGLSLTGVQLLDLMRAAAEDRQRTAGINGLTISAALGLAPVLVTSLVLPAVPAFLMALPFLLPCIGIPMALKSSKYAQSKDLIKLAVKPDIQAELAFEKALARLVSSGALEKDEKMPLAYFLTDLGRECLATSPEKILGHSTPTQAAQTTSASVTTTAAETEQSVPSAPCAIETSRIKALIRMNKQVPGLRGFELLSLIRNRSEELPTLKKLWSEAIGSDAIFSELGRLDEPQKQSICQQLQHLTDLGCLKRYGADKHPEESDWRLTEPGKALLEKGDPVFNGNATLEIVQSLLSEDLALLEKEKARQDNELLRLKSEIDKADESRGKHQQDLDTMKSGLPQDAVDETDMTAVLGLQRLIDGEEKLIRQLQSEYQANEEALEEWVRRTMAVKAELLRLEVEMRTDASRQNFVALIEQLQTLETTQLQGAQQFDVALQAVNAESLLRAQRLNATPKPQDPDTWLKADQILSTMTPDAAALQKALATNSTNASASQ